MQGVNINIVLSHCSIVLLTQSVKERKYDNAGGGMLISFTILNLALSHCVFSFLKFIFLYFHPSTGWVESAKKKTQWKTEKV